MNRNLTDIRNLFSKFTFGRGINAAKILAGYYVSRILQRPVVFGMPMAVSIEPTTSCNLRCPECPSGLRAFTRPTGMLDPEFYRSVVDQIYRKLWYMIFYFQGEPYLHPDFTALVSYAASKKIYTSTSTNAHYLDDENARKTVESGLDRLIISIDGSTQEVYSSYRIGGSLNKVIDGTKNIIKWKKILKSSKPYVVFQFLVVRPNEHQTEEIKKMADELGVDDVAFKTAQLNDYEHGHDLMPSADKYSRYKLQPDGNYILKNDYENHCWKLWHSAVITWDGKVVPCCFDKDASHSTGNLKEENFKSIWQGIAYYNFRKSVLKSRKEIDICTNCAEGTKVWA
jgi:radical SAM protein with 4Fe4S-binding SPASM domain